MTLIEMDHSQRGDAAIIGVNQSDVSSTYRRYLEFGNLENRPRASQYRITTPNQDQFIVKLARRNPNISAKAIRKQFQEAHQNEVAGQTIRKRLHEANLRARRPLKF